MEDTWCQSVFLISLSSQNGWIDRSSKLVIREFVEISYKAAW